MHKLSKTLENITRKLVQDTIAKDYTYWEKMLDENILLITTNVACINGKYDALKAIQSHTNVPTDLKILEQTYHTKQLSKQTIAVISILEGTSTKLSIHAKAMLTFIYDVSTFEIKIKYAHFSTRSANDFTLYHPQAVNDEALFHIIRASFNKDKRSIRLAIPSTSETSYIDPYTIMYIQPFEHGTEIILIDRTIVSTRTFKEWKNILPEYLLQIHRSYIVNVHYINSIRRYEVELHRGVILPIPQKQFTAIQKEIEQRMLAI